MKVKTVPKRNPQNQAAPPKYYGNAVNAGTMTIEKLAKTIADRSSLSRGDIQNVLYNFLEQLPIFLEIGMSVQLGSFGTLRLSVESTGAETPEEFTVSNIKGVKTIFTPGVEFKDYLKKVNYEIVRG